MIHINIKPTLGFVFNQIPNHSFTFSLLDENYKAIHTPFMCKDYLQDMFWCEHTNSSGGIYGIAWKPGILNIKSKRFNLAIHGGDVDLSTHRKHLETLLNFFDKAQKISLTKVLETDDPKVLVVNFSGKWTICGPMLSAFTTLIRISGSSAGEDPLTFFKVLDTARITFNFNGIPQYSIVDIQRLGITLKKIAALLAGLTVNHKWSDIPNIMYAHSTGIYGYDKFPTVEVT